MQNRGRLDYRLRENSPAIDAGVGLEDTADLKIVPHAEYRHPVSTRARQHDESPEAGAFEFDNRM